MVVHRAAGAFSTASPCDPFSTQLPLFQQHPHLRNCVRPMLERAVQELVHPVVDRSIKIALTTCEQIVRKVRSLRPSRLPLVPQSARVTGKAQVHSNRFMQCHIS